MAIAGASGWERFRAVDPPSPKNHVDGMCAEELWAPDGGSGDSGG